MALVNCFYQKSLLFIYLFIIYHDFGDLFQLCIDAEINKDSSSIPKRHIGPDYSIYPFMYAHSLQHPSAFCLDVFIFLHFSWVKRIIVL